MPIDPRPLRPLPSPSVRPWAGSRLAAAEEHVGEVWLAGPDSRVVIDGQAHTLDSLAAEHREALVGRSGMARYGARFPLLAKLIDAADWLSLQVHPDDALARELQGPGAVGKTEAWVILEADEGAELVTGPADGLAAEELLAAIAAGEADHHHCRRTPARPGDVLLLRPGTLHAIGAGTFVYELEQPSDITYRVSDWGRTGRALHIAESARALCPEHHAEPAGEGFRVDGGGLATLDFRLELPDLATAVERAPEGRTCEVITAIRGPLHLDGDGWSETVTPYGTVVVPASAGRYTLRGAADGVACVGSLP